MPKTKRIKSSALEGVNIRHAPLGETIVRDEERQRFASPSQRFIQKQQQQTDNNNNQEEEEEELLDVKTSQRILELSRQQQQDEQIRSFQQQQQQQQTKAINQNQDHDEEEQEQWNEYEQDDEDNEQDNYIQQDENGYVSIVETDELSPQEQLLVAQIMGQQQPQQQQEERQPTNNLTDLILQKIQQHEQAKLQNDDDDQDQPPPLPPKVVAVYTQIGTILSRYTSGKLPKAFKVIPALANWEDVLWLTNPTSWTPQAMMAATRIFASNLNPAMAQRFYATILVPAIHNDIQHSNGRLNHHYYMALKKSVYKPAAFFKGILLPMTTPSSHTTLREAAIIASVLQRVSIPVHHAAVALYKLAETTTTTTSTLTTKRHMIPVYNGVASIFIKTLLQKKYSLPKPVIMALVQYFYSFVHYQNNNHNEQQRLPVLWHQSLLVFCQRYKMELRQQSKAQTQLLELFRTHVHPQITVECRRELLGTRAYQQERQDNEKKDAMEC